MAPAGPGQPPQDVAALIATSGWAKVRDGVGEGDEAVRRLGAEEAKRREALRNAEAQAQSEGKGVWSENPENVRPIFADAGEGDGPKRRETDEMTATFGIVPDANASSCFHP